MLTIEATLLQGMLTVLEPLPVGVKVAREFILIENGIAALTLPIAKPVTTISEEEILSSMALARWVEEASDEKTDWKDHFGLK
jgi:hypothetical protein